ncbi:MAG: thiamine-phosphate kinase [Pseudomonadota bacterium]
MKERDWIDRYIRPLVRASGADQLRDDVALLSSKALTVVTMDTLIEGRHFLSSDPLNTVGQKLVRVNVSDIHAKGALPKEALLSIAWPKDRDEAEFATLMSGIGEDITTYGIDLIGGDTVSTAGPLVLTLTLTGQCLSEAPVRRAGKVTEGAKLWLSGPVGGGVLGLNAALNGGDEEDIRRYRCPDISNRDHAKRVSSKALASIDISDGLLLDTLALAETNGQGAHIDLDKVWFYRPSKTLDDTLEQVTGGDDYQIVIATRSDITFDPRYFRCFGHFTSQPGLALVLNGTPLPLPEKLGFEHE